MIGIFVPSEYVGGGFTDGPSDSRRGGYLAKLFATFSTSSTRSATCTSLTSLYFGSQQMCAFAMTCRAPVSIFSKRQMTAMSLRMSTRLNISSVFLKSGRCMATVLNSRGCFSTSWYLPCPSEYGIGESNDTYLDLLKKIAHPSTSLRSASFIVL